MNMVADRQWTGRQDSSLLGLTEPLVAHRLSGNDIDLHHPDGGWIERERRPNTIRLPVCHVERIICVPVVNDPVRHTSLDGGVAAIAGQRELNVLDTVDDIGGRSRRCSCVYSSE
jgi:hypothetical protein